VETGEDCDGTDFRGATCQSLGAGSGTLACGADCRLDRSGCVLDPVCGDGIAGGHEQCDGADLAQHTCESQGFTAGTLSCSASCELVTSGCSLSAPPQCGNGVAEGAEPCDGADLRKRTCETENLGTGTLTCSPTCQLLTSGCTSAPPAVCGDGVVNGTEACDGTNLGGASCPGSGFTGGVLSCSADCRLDTSRCTSGAACDYDAGTRTGVVLRADTSEHMSRISKWKCSDGGSGPDVSATWTPEVSGCYQAMVTSDKDLDTLLGVFETCGLQTWDACDDNGGADQFSLLEFQATAGKTYAIVVDSYFNSDSGPIQVRISPCAPPEWTCDPAKFGRDDGCDCGCAVLDPDCNGDSSALACGFCDDPKSCAGGQCSAIRATENWACN
jgi:hypothetical protein